MIDIVDEFERRRKMLVDLNYLEASARISGFYKWLLSEPELKRLIEGIFSKVDVAPIIELANPRHPPQASEPIEIAAIGIASMKIISEGSDPTSLAIRKGIRPAFDTRNSQEILNELMKRYIDPSIEYLAERIEGLLGVKRIPFGSGSHSLSYPLEITQSLELFNRDHPEYRRNGFVMMRFGETGAHLDILEAIRATLAKYAIEALRADDRQYHDDLFPNVQTYIHGCSFGIAVFERLETDDFNPNVSLEVGYMRALGKSVCLLKDRTLRTLQTDLVGKLYKSFDPQNPLGSIPAEIDKWMRDKEIITL